MSRSRVTGPLTGAYASVALFLPTNAGKGVFKAPANMRLMEVGLYAQTSTAGTATLANTTQSVTWVSAQALVADTSLVVAAASLVGVRDINKGDVITLTGGGTSTNLTAVVTFKMVDHVVSTGEIPDAND